jgi:hypothetical protein
MDALWSDYIWPLAIIVAESVLLIVLLLIAGSIMFSGPTWEGLAAPTR